MNVAFAAFGLTDPVVGRTEFYRQDLEILRSLGHQVELVKTPFGVSRRFDALFVWWWNYLWMWGPVAKALGLPILTTGVFDLAIDESWPAWKRRLKYWGVTFSDLHVFISQYEARSVALALGLPQGKVRYCPLAIDTTVYRVANEHLNTGTFTILNVTWQEKRNLKRKMLFELLEAFALVYRERQDVRLILAGPPEDGGIDLRRSADALRVGHAVSFPGELTREEKIRLMQQCSLYCQVSRYEGFGLAIAEAMACGAPVLVSAVGAVPEVVGECGTYVMDLTVQGLANGLRECLANEADQTRRRRLAASRVEAEFSRERRRRDLGSWLEGLVQSRK